MPYARVLYGWNRGLIVTSAVLEFTLLSAVHTLETDGCDLSSLSNFNTTMLNVRGHFKRNNIFPDKRVIDKEFSIIREHTECSERQGAVSDV